MNGFYEKFEYRLLCLAKPVTRLVLEKNLDKNDETIHRYLRQVRPKPSPVFTTRKMMYQLMTTKKPSSWNADHITSLATTGMETIGVVANAVGSIFGRTPTQPPSGEKNESFFESLILIIYSSSTRFICLYL